MKNIRIYFVWFAEHMIWLVRWYLMILGYMGLVLSSFAHHIVNFYTITATIFAIIVFAGYLLYWLLNKTGTMLVEQYRSRQ